jgi:hypothetical protein
VAGFALSAATTTIAAAPEADLAPNRNQPGEIRYCTKAACAGTKTLPWGNAAAFGAAVVATGVLARGRL